MHRITLTLERAAGGLALVVMLALLALTFGAPVPTAAQPIIIVATPRIAEQEPAVVDQPPIAAEPTPALPTPAPTVAPTIEPSPVAVVAESPPPESKLVIESDGSVRLPGVDDWMANLPPEPEPTAAPVVSAPLPPRGGCGPRCGWHP